ncbi:MAG: hypothetical protein WCR20_08915 [Verrucomicrobiota bacterium]
MKNNEIENIWKNVDSKISPKSVDELNQLLTSKTKKTVNKFLYILCVDFIVCFGLMIFLIITAFNRQSDIIYQVNNYILILITLSSLIVSLLSWKKLQNNKYNLSLKDWVEERIKLLSSWLLGKYSKLYIILIPILLIMINLSIHVYYEHKPFIEVMKNEESIYGLIIGFIIGLFASYFAIEKIRKYQIKNLEYLKELYGALNNVG